MDHKTKWLFHPSVLQKTLYFQSDNGYTLMVMENRRHEVLDIPLKKIEKNLSCKLFLRLHRSYLVNKDAISEFRHYRTHYFAYVCGYRIPVSRRRKKMIMESLDFI
ncbi:MAG: LytTR family DNA-binding domain-containing protein [Bacteroidales bacterium]